MKKYYFCGMKRFSILALTLMVTLGLSAQDRVRVACVGNIRGVNQK